MQEQKDRPVRNLRSPKHRLRLWGELLTLLPADYLAIHLSTYLTWWLRFRSGIFTDPEPFPLPPAAIVVLSLFWMLIFALRGQYRKLHVISRLRSLQQVFFSVLVGLIVLFVVTFEPTRPFSAGRLALLTYGLGVFLGAGAGRVLYRTIQKRLLEHGIGLRNTLIIGDSSLAAVYARQFRIHPGMGYRVLGRVSTQSDQVAASDGEDSGGGSFPLLGGMEHLGALMEEHAVQELLLTEADRDVLFDVIHAGVAQGAEVLVVPDLHDLVLGNVRATDVWGQPTIQVMPHLMAPWQFLLKRLLDILVSLILLLLCLPFFLLLPPMIRRASPGAPAMYHQRRVGRKGREFTLYKFRTMHPLPEECDTGVSFDEERVFPLGRWLRRYRIDEIPQFWNILRGQMSLVGPRPEQRGFVEQFIRAFPLYVRRHNIRPGLTGWAQVRQAYDESVSHPEDKLRLDLFYLQNMSLELDLKILFFTIRTVLRGQGV